MPLSDLRAVIVVASQFHTTGWIRSTVFARRADPIGPPNRIAEENNEPVQAGTGVKGDSGSLGPAALRQGRAGTMQPVRHLHPHSGA